VRERDSRGSVLALVPAAVLVLFLLGALAVDSASAYLAQRQLSDAVAGAANDAATAGLSDAAFYQQGQLAVDAATAALVVCQSVDASLDARLHLTAVQIAVDGRWVHVRAAAVVRRIILTGEPLVSPWSTVRAAAAAVAVRSPADAIPTHPLAWTDVSC
jgi:Flp pilus assembly protein TadG